MAKWEYAMVNPSDDELAQIGRDGWEVYKVIPQGDSRYTGVDYCMPRCQYWIKREIKEGQPPLPKPFVMKLGPNSGFP